MTGSNELVVVTGATGFIAKHCILQLLAAGYRVRGTVRRPESIAGVRDTVLRHVAVPLDSPDQLRFSCAKLEAEAGWSEALRDASYVLHVASPVPRSLPKRPDDVILPACEGTLRVLRAASAAHVRRVVLTSSTSAVLYGHARDGSRTYDEDDWSLLSEYVSAYDQSKTLAERAAWDFVRAQPPEARLELVSINPGVVLGPVLDQDFSISGEIVRKLLSREIPGCPDLGWAVVDVRDVAAAHLAALTVDAAAGQRFITAIEHVSMLQIAQTLSQHFTVRGFKVPVRRLPSQLLKLIGRFDKTVAMTIPELGKRQDVSSDRARRVLGWTSRSLPEMVVAMAESMIELGIVRART